MVDRSTFDDGVRAVLLHLERVIDDLEKIDIGATPQERSAMLLVLRSFLKIWTRDIPADASPPKGMSPLMGEPTPAPNLNDAELNAYGFRAPGVPFGYRVKSSVTN